MKDTEGTKHQLYGENKHKGQEQKMNIQTKLQINGSKQFVSISSQKQEAPLLLYLHGGPGDAALPLFLKYNQELEKTYTVVVWEQRGAGKSYYKFQENEKISIDIFVQDLLELTRYLLKHFEKKKLFLIGHSWGSVLGLRFIREYPQYIHAYIGCGQVVNMRKSCQFAYDYALANTRGRNRKRLQKIDCSYAGDNWLKDLLLVTGQVVKQKGSLYGSRNYLKLTLPFLRSKHYSICDLWKRQKGSLQSIRFLWQELMDTDFEEVLQYEVPIVFVEGRYDSHVSSSLAERYYNTIRSQKRFVWFEQSCHFPQWSENHKFNCLMRELQEQETFL